jgi:predicted pyridoxine 5'-phosphate oxidase superfamily flavin-nucleotide-binding protein
MAVLDSDMRRVILEQKLGFVATVCPDGTPNLSPKGTTTVWDDDHLLFADIRSPQTVRNLQEKPVAEINVVDPIVRKGYRFKGPATVHSEDEVYERGLALLAERGYDASPERVRTIVLVRVEEAAPLISPAYDAGATEEVVAAHWERHLTDLLERRGASHPPGPN